MEEIVKGNIRAEEKKKKKGKEIEKQKQYQSSWNDNGGKK